MYTSQQMLDLQRFLTRLMLCDNQMTIILEISLYVFQFVCVLQDFFLWNQL